LTILRLKADGVFWRESSGEIVALDASTSRYLSANPSAALLWRRLVDGATEEELTDALCERYGIAREPAARDVAAFVEQLSTRGLLQR
jgi:hypothetical protein